MIVSQPDTREGWLFYFMLIVFTGEGKGKTTAAIGQAVRSLGQGQRVAWVQFFKNYQRFPAGEYFFFLNWHWQMDFFSFCPEHPFFNPQLSFKHLEEECQKAWLKIRNILNDTNYNLLILDEFNIVVGDEYMSWNKIMPDIVSFQKDTRRHLIITGRGAPDCLISLADLVTEMRKMKHPYDREKSALPGLEF